MLARIPYLIRRAVLPSLHIHRPPDPGLVLYGSLRASLHTGRNAKRGKPKQAKPGGSTKPRGRPDDSPSVRISKTVSYLLRHGADAEGLTIRPDGYMRVSDLLANPRLKSLGTVFDFTVLQEIVKNDVKNRFDLKYEAESAGAAAGEEGVNPTSWWIRANQGHSMKSIHVDLIPVLSAKEIPMAVHGTTLQAWESIRKEGLSKMQRNHIHMAQGVPGDMVISGMRASSQVLIYIDVDKALAAGIKFFVSANGVVLTEGDERGFLNPQFFSRVEDGRRNPIKL